MKKTIIAFLSIATIIACSDKKSETNLHISGNIKGLKKGTLYIQKLVDTSLVVIDTIKIDGDSKFESDLNIKSPEMYYLFLDRGVTNSRDNNLLFFAEPGNIKIETTLEKFLFNAKISGSKNNDLYKEYREVTSRYSDESLNLTAAKFNAYKFKHQDQLAIIDAKQDAITKRRYLYTVNFAVNHGDFEVAPFVALSDIYDVNLKYMDTIQKSMTPKVAKSLYGKQLTKLLAERSKNEK